MFFLGISWESSGNLLDLCCKSFDFFLSSRGDPLGFAEALLVDVIGISWIFSGDFLKLIVITLLGSSGPYLRFFCAPLSLSEGSSWDLLGLFYRIFWNSSALSEVSTNAFLVVFWSPYGDLPELF